MNLKEFKKDLFGKLTPRQKKIFKREEAKFKAKCAKYKKNGVNIADIWPPLVRLAVPICV